VSVVYEPGQMDNKLFTSVLPPKPEPPVQPASVEVFVEGFAASEALDGPEELTSFVREDFATDAASQAFDIEVKLVNIFILSGLPRLSGVWLVGVFLGNSW
jgi:hypothetical protein